jgi:hypothetical protein
MAATGDIDGGNKFERLKYIEGYGFSFELSKTSINVDSNNIYINQPSVLSTNAEINNMIKNPIYYLDTFLHIAQSYLVQENMGKRICSRCNFENVADNLRCERCYAIMFPYPEKIFFVSTDVDENDCNTILKIYIQPQYQSVTFDDMIPTRESAGKRSTTNANTLKEDSDSVQRKLQILKRLNNFSFKKYTKKSNTKKSNTKKSNTKKSNTKKSNTKKSNTKKSKV